MAELTSLKNIGKEMKFKLQSVGVDSAEELKNLGSKIVFAKLKMRFQQVCLVHLYSLQGAIDNVDYNMLEDDVKRDLKTFSDSLK